MGTRLWLVTLALAACVGAFTYWQVRVPLDGALRHGGASAATLRLGVSLALGVLAAGLIAGARQVTLRGRAARARVAGAAGRARAGGSATSRARRDCRRWRRSSPWLAAWLAGIGPALPVHARACSPLGPRPRSWLVTRLACALALRAPAVTHPPSRRLPAAWRALVSARRPARHRRAWRHRDSAPGRAGARSRASTARCRCAPARHGRGSCFGALALVLSVAAWFVGGNPLEQRAQAFAVFSIACAMLGAWAAWRAAADPAIRRAAAAARRSPTPGAHARSRSPSCSARRWCCTPPCPRCRGSRGWGWRSRGRSPRCSCRSSASTSGSRSRQAARRGEPLLRLARRGADREPRDPARSAGWCCCGGARARHAATRALEHARRWR